MRQIIARYPGTCATSGRAIAPGEPILYDPRTRKTYSTRTDETAPGAALALDIDPTLDRDTAEAIGLYMTQAARRYQSDIFRANGREYFQNRRGRCEDAPCCGCCNT